MNQQQPYIYNRGREIKESFGSAADSLGKNIQNVIDFKQKSFDYAKKQYEDIDLLKDDLNKFDNEIITGKVNALREKMKSTIISSGKIDFKALGDIRSEISSIKDAKRNSAMKAKSIEEATALVFKNAPDMKNVFETSEQMNAILRDPNKLFSKKDISSEINEVLKHGINMYKKNNDKLDAVLGSFGKGSLSDSWLNERKDVMVSKFKVIDGLTFKNGAYVPSKEGSDPYGDMAKQIFSPEDIQLFNEQNGSAVMYDKDPLVGVRELVKMKLNGTIQTAISMVNEKRESVVAETNKRRAYITNQDKHYNLLELGYFLKKKIGESTISGNTARTALLQKKLSTFNAESARKGIIHEEASGQYYYDEEQDRTTKESLMDMIGEMEAEKNGGGATPKKKAQKFDPNDPL